MIATDRDALICDLAETYGIFDYRGLPVPLLATLASGLREDSRIKMKISNTAVNQDTILLACAVDALHLLVWGRTKDAKTGRNRPQSIAQVLMQRRAKPADDVMIFHSGEAFDAAWARLAGGERDVN